MCTFCAIARGDAAAEVVLDNERSVAFLDVRPLFPGHCLVIPRTHRETLVDLAPEEVGPLFQDVRAVAGAVQVALDAQGTFVAMNNKVSQSVPHLHVHVVPRRTKDGLRGFFWPRTRYEPDSEMGRIGAEIRGALAAVAS